jgi:polysaccharide deacetylase family protein (PEP-CTERM system associated)
MAKLRNILSIDIEEVFHAEYAKDVKKSHLSYRAPCNIPFVLDLLRDEGANATFFVVGEIAEKFPEVIGMIAKEGHEVAFHSYDHKPLWGKNPKQLKTEIERFNELLTSMTGVTCLGFRAPSFSLDNKTKWTLEVLETMRILYDSSVFPAWTPLYGVSSAPVRPYKPSNDDLTVEDVNGKLWEFPLAVYSLVGLRIPAAGGFYLRFTPSLVWRAIKKINKLGSPAVVYVHNWELDSETPKLKLNPYKSFVTYHNIDKTAELFKHLLREFQFTSFAEYMKSAGMV